MNPDLPLRDIHMPDAVSGWPPALGWWLLLGLIILLTVLVWSIRKYLISQRLRKHALAELNLIEGDFAQHQNTQKLASDISVLLRRICISRFPRAEVAGLNGNAWLAFLNSRANAFDAETCSVLIDAPFKKQYEFNEVALINACRYWIEQLKAEKGIQA